MPAVVQLPAGKVLTVRSAADVFLDSLGNPNTVRNYGIGVGKIAERIGEARPLAAVADDEIGEALEAMWGRSAANTWNARRASVLSWLGWCRERGYDGPAVPAWAKRPHAAGLTDPGPLEDGGGPADRPARGRAAGEDAVADALRDLRPIRGDPGRQH